MVFIINFKEGNLVEIPFTILKELKYSLPNLALTLEDKANTNI